MEETKRKLVPTADIVAHPEPRLRLVVPGTAGAPESAPSRDPSAQAAEQLLAVELPPRPAVLVDLSAEMQKEEPDFGRVNGLVSADVGLAAAVIKTANSPYFGLGRRASSVQQAIYYLGLGEVFSIVTGLLLRQAFPSRDPIMERLWDASSQRAAIMGRMARSLGCVASDRAHTCGLFENCGMAVLIQHAPGYAQSVAQIESAPNPQEVEREHYGLDHTVIGDALVRTWGLPDTIAQAVKHHHDVLALPGLGVARESAVLVALSALVHRGLDSVVGRTRDHWEQEAVVVSTVLGRAAADLELHVAEILAEVKAAR